MLSLWRLRFGTFSMPMPKTSMHGNNFFPPRENKIRLTRKTRIMKNAPNPNLAYHLANSKFGLRMLTSNQAHPSMMSLERPFNPRFFFIQR